MTRLAIIGMGPRGLYALENLLIQLSANNLEIEIFIFESSDHPGSGNVWHQQQPESNWINITERELSGITARPGFTFANITFEAFPSYHDWCNFNLVPSENDKFPPRSKLGKYLHERFKAIAQNFKSLSLFNFIETDITEVDYQDNKIIIKSKANLWSFDDLLLTIGHQPTKLSDQIEQWKAHADRNENLKVFDSPYPVNTLSELRGCTELTIGIRGFGLAMIDVMRYLVINNYGNFKVINPSTLETVYYKTQPQHLKLIPFSLDGLPLAPKPLNEIIDAWYQPKGQELAYFKSSLETAAQESIAANSLDFLIAPIAKIASRVFNDLKEKSVSHSMNKDEIETQIKSWLKDENYKHDVFQDETIATYKLIQAYIEMALGNAKVSLDYCVWQVWRHCQPSLYEAFSHAQVKKQIIKKVITLDERSKRFSYGPPIESMQQLLALVDAQIVTLDFVEDPDISLTEDGWRLKNGDDSISTSTVMVNSVLDAPKLLEINSEIIQKLLSHDFIQPIHSDLGIETRKNGFVKTADDKPDVSIAVLGRLAKGSVIGVDAILECFGPRIEDWAEAYVKKLKSS